MSDEQTPNGAVEEAKVEAEEVKADIAEAKAEAAQARAEGDTDRAAEVDAKIASLTSDLGEIKAAIKTLAERPFAPAPQPKAKVEETPETPAEKPKPKERVHRFGSRAWFGDRAYEDAS